MPSRPTSWGVVRALAVGAAFAGCTHFGVKSSSVAPAPTPHATPTPVPQLQRPGLKILEVRFDPDAEHATTFSLTATLTFANQSAQPLLLRDPDFRLDLDGVSLGDLYTPPSTGVTVPPFGSYTISLRKELPLRFASEEIMNVLARVKHGQPVSVLVAGHVRAGETEPPNRVFLHQELPAKVLP